MVWGEMYRKSDRSVDVYVGKLRQKLDDGAPGPVADPHALRLRLPIRRPEQGLYTLFTSRRQADNRLPRDRVTVSPPRNDP